MAHDTDSAVARLRLLADGFKISQAVYVLVVTGVADLLAEGERTSDELAAEAGLHPRSLYRLLRALAAAGILHEDEGQRFEMTELGELLRSSTPGSLAAWTEYMGGSLNWRIWGNLVESVRTGKTGYQILFGTDAWTYRGANPAEQAVFDRAMVSATGDSEAVMHGYDFSRFHTVVDVGGGRGAFVGALLAHHPSMSGILFDQPHVVAAASQVLEGFGVHDRCRIVGGSFFDEVPGDGDAYVLKSVIHDWDDAHAGRILAACRSCVPAGSTLLLLERVLAPPNQGLADKLSDLNMLVNPGGMERTRDEFGALLDRSGFRLQKHVSTSGAQAVLEAVPV